MIKAVSEIYKLIQEVIGEDEHCNNLSSAKAVSFVTEHSRAN
jgi:hypothetical protein